MEYLAVNKKMKREGIGSIFLCHFLIKVLPRCFIIVGLFIEGARQRPCYTTATIFDSAIFVYIRTPYNTNISFSFFFFPEHLYQLFAPQNFFSGSCIIIRQTDRQRHIAFLVQPINYS